ncbi:hypothetical protein IAT40_000694 [Kwoniella sp. CBS 6097]
MAQEILTPQHEPFTCWLQLPVDVDAQKVQVDWDELKGTEDWKCLSLVRYKCTWVQPQLHSCLSSHPNLASHLLLLKSEADWNTTLILYPVSTLNINHNLIVDKGKIYSNLRNGVKKVVEIAKQLIGGGQAVEAENGEQNEDYIWDDLGVCTWESFLQPNGDRDRPTLDLLQSLIPPFPIKSYLIDDGWQDVTALGQKGKLSSFEAWDGMNSDMTTVVKALKNQGIEKVGVWCTLQGYWYGIDPDSELRAKYDCVQHKTNKAHVGRGGAESTWLDHVERMWKGVSGHNSMWLPSIDKAEMFWRDYFAKIKSWGIDFVKVDNQAFHETATGQGARHIQQALWSGMLAALKDTWDTRSVIMCMSHNERMLNGPGGLGFSRPGGKLVFRNSDDFALDYPNTHPDHIHFNLLNSILTSHLFIPDLDMFASAPSDLLPTYHALLRLTNRWFWDGIKEGTDGPALVGGTKFGEFGGIIAAWNAHAAKSKAIAKDKITLRDIQDVIDLDETSTSTSAKANEYYVVSTLGLNTDKPFSIHNTTFTLFSESTAQDDAGAKVDVHLEKGHCEAYVVSKLYEVGNETKAAILGMRDKFASLAGIGEPVVEDGKFRFTTKFADDHFALLVVRAGADENQGAGDTATTASNVKVSIEVDRVSQSCDQTTAKIVAGEGKEKRGTVISFSVANGEENRGGDASERFEIVVSFE